MNLDHAAVVGGIVGGLVAFLPRFIFGAIMGIRGAKGCPCCGIGHGLVHRLPHLAGGPVEVDAEEDKKRRLEWKERHAKEVRAMRIREAALAILRRPGNLAAKEVLDQAVAYVDEVEKSGVAVADYDSPFIGGPDEVEHSR